MMTLEILTTFSIIKCLSRFVDHSFIQLWCPDNGILLYFFISYIIFFVLGMQENSKSSIAGITINMICNWHYRQPILYAHNVLFIELVNTIIHQTH